MKVLITGSSGHLGEALIRTLQRAGHEAVGLDVLGSPFTQVEGSITDRDLVKKVITGVTTVLHTATLHKPHVGTHTRQEFIDTNITGTLNLLEESVVAGVRSFVFTSTTSTFGGALSPPPNAPAAWITEDVVPVPKNIYGVSKVAAEDLCQLFHRNYGLPCIVLRTSRFFPEKDDDGETHAAYADANVKANEFLNRRVDISDVVSSHLLAMEKASEIGFGRYIISATSPFTQSDLEELHQDAPAVVRRHVPGFEEVYAPRGWKMFPKIGRVYVNARARHDLGWNPVYDFAYLVERLRRGEDPRSDLAREVGSKGYHPEELASGLYARV